MIRRNIFLWVISLSTIQLIAMTLFAIWQIWLDDSQFTGGGSGTFYAACAMLTIIVAQLANVPLLISARKSAMEISVIVYGDMATLGGVYFALWLGDRYQYSGM